MGKKNIKQTQNEKIIVTDVSEKPLIADNILWLLLTTLVTRKPCLCLKQIPTAQ